jgi:hypothetical protein
MAAALTASPEASDIDRIVGWLGARGVDIPAEVLGIDCYCSSAPVVKGWRCRATLS